MCPVLEGLDAVRSHFFDDKLTWILELADVCLPLGRSYTKVVAQTKDTTERNYADDPKLPNWYCHGKTERTSCLVVGPLGHSATALVATNELAC